MSEPRKIRCGVAGVGFLGQHHARNYASLPGAELVGIYEVSDARAKEICDKYNCRRFATIEELGEACEAISVVVPTDRHCEVALPLLAKGRHLLIEKPLCASLEEAERILSAANATGAIVQVGHIEHFNPVMSWLEKEVHQPRIINAFRHAPYQPRGTEVGVTLDLMIHDIGIALRLARSPVEKVEAAGLRILSPTEDLAHARVTFRNGCVANLSASRVAAEKTRRIEVYQPSAQLSMDFINQEGWLTKKLGNTLQREHVPLAKVEPLRAELESFLASVEARRQPAISGVFGRDALGLALEITAQIRATFGDENLAPVTRVVTAASANRRLASRTFLRPPERGRPDLLIVAGEHSGDQHAAAALRQLIARRPGANICALGGPALREAGAQLLLDMTETSVVGFWEVMRHIGHFRRLYSKAIDWIATYQPRAVCFVDYPGLNLRLAAALRRKGISRRGGGNVRALYYISPQVWAWKARRRFAMAEALDALGVIFPFEVGVFADTSLKAEFLGHPFMAESARRPVTLDPNGPTLLLPGSREQTVARIFPPMLEAWKRFSARRPDERAAVVYPDGAIRSQLEALLLAAGLNGRVELRSHDEPTAGKAALVASGTMSLHCALAGLPGAIVYRANAASIWLARRLVKVRRIGIANLLLGRDVYPELIQEAATPEALERELLACLGEEARRQSALRDAAELKRLLAAPPDLDVGAWLERGIG